MLSACCSGKTMFSQCCGATQKRYSTTEKYGVTSNQACAFFAHSLPALRALLATQYVARVIGGKRIVSLQCTRSKRSKRGISVRDLVSCVQTSKLYAKRCTLGSKFSHFFLQQNIISVQHHNIEDKQFFHYSQQTT